MLSRLFPRQFDNDYRGYTIAIWLLVPIAILKLAMGCNTIFNTTWVIENADRVPLADYGPKAAHLVIFLFQSWGLGLALMSLLGLIACLRYRSMVPLAYLILLAEDAGRKLLGLLSPLELAPGGPSPSFGTMVNIGLIAALLIGFVLSLGPADEPANAT